MDMPFTIDAVYVEGQFRPMREVKLPENTMVRLTIQPLPTWEEWLARTAAHRQAMFAKYGYYADSSELIRGHRYHGA